MAQAASFLFLRWLVVPEEVAGEEISDARVVDRSHLACVHGKFYVGYKPINRQPGSTMLDDDCERVLERLNEHRDSGRHLELADFADLGLSNDEIGGCVRLLIGIGWADGHVHESDRDFSGVDRVVVWLTEKGKAECDK